MTLFEKTGNKITYSKGHGKKVVKLDEYKCSSCEYRGTRNRLMVHVGCKPFGYVGNYDSVYPCPAKELAQFHSDNLVS